MEAFDAEQAPVLLIDEIDKADIEFPNDLLRELDQMEFYVYETRQQVRARQRPIILITSNNEKNCPTRFCVAVFITSAFPTPTPAPDRAGALPRPARAADWRGAGGVSGRARVCPA